MLSVSVVIPILNAERTLAHCLKALAQLDPAPLEIVLVDNGSTDGTMGLLEGFASSHKRCLVRILREPREGAAAARNAGFRAVRGVVVAFTDSDCAPEPAWLSSLIQPFEDQTIGAVAGRVVAAPAAATIELFNSLYTLQLPEHPAKHSCWTPWKGGYPTANLAVRRALLEDLDGFDQGITIYGEDYDLCARLYGRGVKLLYIPEARVEHRHRTSLAGTLRQAFGIGRSHPYLLRRHASRGLWVELPWCHITWPKSPIPAWMDLASADKKVLAIVALGAMYGPLIWLLALLALWLAATVAWRAKRAGVPVNLLAAANLAGLLVLKSAAMTAGRWWGSIRYGALCF